MRIPIPLIGGVLLAFACAPTDVVRPADGGNLGASTAGGLTLYAAGNVWQGRPNNLAEYLVPIWIDIVNTPEGRSLPRLSIPFVMVED